MFEFGIRNIIRMKRRLYDQVKESVEYIGRNWRSFVFVVKLLRFVWDIFFGM